jgi:hypothetical protein
MTTVAIDSEDRRQSKAEAEREELALQDLPGTHLSWRKIGWAKWALVTQNGQGWATMTHRIRFALAPMCRSVAVSEGQAPARRWAPPSRSMIRGTDAVARSLDGLGLMSPVECNCRLFDCGSEAPWSDMSQPPFGTASEIGTFGRTDAESGG